MVLICVETTVGERINSAPPDVARLPGILAIQNILAIEVEREKPSTYGRKATYIPLNVNKGESSTFFSLIQGNSLVPVKQNQLRRQIANMERNGHYRWCPATINALGDQWRHW